MSILDRFRLNGKRLLITGGSRGLGREMALAMASAGADVVLTGRTQESLDATAEEIRELGRSAWTIQGDMGDLNDCEQVCQQAVSQHGPIDILVNNVGGRRENIPTESMPTETWLRLIDLNLNSTFVCTKIIGDAMIRHGQGGRIINISSINGLVAGRNIQGRHYETAKAAVIQFTRSIAVDWAPHRITANVICPGGFMTEPNLRWAESNPEVIDSFRKQIPLGDYGQPEDLGPLALYLASDAARYVTGAVFVIDGGYTLV